MQQMVKIKTIDLAERTAPLLLTEILFNLASERAESTEVIRFDLIESDQTIRQRAFSAALKILKAQKREGKLQLVATPQSFSEPSTEGQYLLNKYPSLPIPTGEELEYLFVKL